MAAWSRSRASCATTRGQAHPLPGVRSLSRDGRARDGGHRRGGRGALGTDRVAIAHRVGRLEIGECSVVVVVACAHRGEAFEACRYAIDTLKSTVPIWKKEVAEDGEEWVEG